MKKKMRGSVILAVVSLMLFVVSCSPKSRENADPTVVTIWHYYNGTQKDQFDKLVKAFNETAGREKGIVVEAYNKGYVDELEQAVQEGLDGKVGSDRLPDAYAAYADTAFKADKMGAVLDLSTFWSPDEQKEYMDAYVEEGRFDDTGSVKLFPIAKSTELFAVNCTDWNKFSEAAGASDESFATWEGITKVAEEYYRWTDSLTETPDDGKAFFGRDAFANYILVGSRQLGHEIYRMEDGKPVLDFDKDTMRRLWDNFYIPYINGYFASYGKFRSDDVKTGDLLAFVGSTSGVTFFPASVTKEDGTTYVIENKIYPLPNFADTEPWAVQQGAGMVVLKSDEASEKATVEFLKWFTGEEENLSFSVESGYLPVKKAANDREKLAALLETPDSGGSNLIKQCLYTGFDILNTYQLYTSKPFNGGGDVRNIVSSMEEKAIADRKTVVDLTKAGASRENAVAKFSTDDNFDDWYEDTKEKLTAVGE